MTNEDTEDDFFTNLSESETVFGSKTDPTLFKLTELPSGASTETSVKRLQPTETFIDPFIDLEDDFSTEEDNTNTSENFSSFKSDYSIEFEWLKDNASTNNFAFGCLECIRSRGSLSPRQLESVRNTITRENSKNDPDAQVAALKKVIAREPENKSMYKWLVDNRHTPEGKKLLGNLVQYQSFTQKQKAWTRNMMIGRSSSSEGIEVISGGSPSSTLRIN